MMNDNHRHRRYLILNLIKRFGPVSRTELTELTDLRAATVGEITKELLEEELIVHSGYVSHGHGRRRTMLQINNTRICAIGISITTACVTTVVAQLDGTILSQAEDPIVPAESRAALEERIAGRIALLLDEFGERKIVGIGIADQLYDPLLYPRSGSLMSIYAHFNDWVHLNLKPRLERVSALPTRTFSPVILPALAQMRFGAAKDVRDFLCVELSNGIGASICTNGCVVAGAAGVAGELGHTLIDLESDARMCYCGRPGCVEMTTAFPALVEQINAALERGVFSSLQSVHGRPRQITPRDIRRALDEGDQMCRYYVKRAAMRLGAAIANAVNLLNPSLVVLYGFMLEMGEFFLEQLCAAIRENVLSLAGNFTIRTSSMLESMLPLGAAAEMFNEFLRLDEYQWVYRLGPMEPRQT